MERSSITSSAVGEVCVLTVGGVHNEYLTGAIRDAIVAAVDGLPAALVIDFTGLTFGDSTLLRALMLGDEHARAGGVPLVLVVPSPHRLRTMLTMTQLLDQFTIHLDLDAALAALAARGARLATSGGTKADLSTTTDEPLSAS
jgi:anti-anti-sigma factor